MQFPLITGSEPLPGNIPEKVHDDRALPDIFATA